MCYRRYIFNQLTGLWTPIIGRCWTLMQSTYHVADTLRWSSMIRWWEIIS